MKLEPHGVGRERPARQPCPLDRAPTAILRRWKADTEPQEEKDAKRMLKGMRTKESPRLDLLADTEGERDDARRHAEDLRGLLGRVLKEVEELSPELREAIERALAT
jgi:hypothetical protein